MYVGQTRLKNPANRFKSHCGLLRKGNHYNKHLQSAWLKYKECSFSFEVIESAAESNLNEREVYWINKLKAINHLYGYNMTTGGSGCNGIILSAESRKKIGDSSRLRGGGRVGGAKLSGLKRPQEVVDRIRNSNTGKKRTEKMVEAMRVLKTGGSNKSLNKEIFDSLGNSFASVNSAASFHKISAKIISNNLNMWSKATRSGVVFYYTQKGG